MNTLKSIEDRMIICTRRIVDLHFDLPMIVRKTRAENVLETEFLPELDAGNLAVSVGFTSKIAILPEMICA